MNSDMVRSEKYGHLHLVYHFTVPLKQHFLSSIFFRFLLMLAIYKKSHIFVLAFACFVKLLSKYKNSFFLLLLIKIYVANIRFEFRSCHQRCSIKAVLKNFALLSGKHLCWSLFLIKRDSNIGVFLLT